MLVERWCPRLTSAAKWGGRHRTVSRWPDLSVLLARKFRQFIFQYRSGSRVKAPSSWSSLQTLFTVFDCRNDQNLNLSHNSPPNSWPVVSRWGLSDIWGKLSPLTHVWRRHCSCGLEWVCCTNVTKRLRKAELSAQVQAKIFAWNVKRHSKLVNG